MGNNPQPLRSCDGCYEKYKQISPVVRSKDDAKRNYDRLCSVYDLFSSYEREYRDEGIRLLNIKTGERILEIGFGTGASLVQFAKLVGPLGGVYGVDISDGMKREALKRVHRDCPNVTVQLEVADAANVPFETAFFDAIFLCFTLELFSNEEISVVLQECSRVLKPSGRICVVALSKKGTGRVVNLYHYLHYMLPNLVDCRPIFASETLQSQHFIVVSSKEMPMFGLLVEVVLAHKHYPNS